MYKLIWHWTKGNKKIYTRRIEIVDKAIKEGYFVISLKPKPKIFGSLKN